MNNPLEVVEAARWNKIGRRWSILLGVLLTVNLSLVVVAVRGYAAGQPPATATASEPESDVASISSAPVTTTPTKAQTPTEAQSEPVEVIATNSPQASVEPSFSEPALAGEPDTIVAPLVVDRTAPNPIEKTPAEPVDRPVPPAPTETRAELIIVNLPHTGGVVHFLVDDEVVSLEAGEYHRLATEQSRRVVFHQGDEFENVTLNLEAGVFAFSVSTEGWQLQAAGEEVDELLMFCHEVAAK